MNRQQGGLLATLLVVGLLDVSSGLGGGSVGAARAAEIAWAEPDRGARVTLPAPPSGHAALPPGLVAALHRTPLPVLGATTTVSGTAWVQQAELTSTAQTANDAYGEAVAVSGNTAVVGASGTRPTYPSPDYGAVYIFTRTASGVWQQQAELLDPGYGGGQGDAFGIAVALQGNTLAVGAPGANGGLGAVYLYGRTGSTWTLQTTLTPADATQPENFATALALNGATLAVGANYQHNGAGAVYVFVYSNGTWSQQAELTYPGRVLYAKFGWALALWGNTLVVGAPDAPVAFVYARSGSTWYLQSLLYAPHAPSLFFGSAVAVWGNTALVSACCDLANRLPGAVAVFTRSGTIWRTQTVLTPTNSTPGDLFGDAVALSGDTAVIGGLGDYVFVGSGGTWGEQAELQPSNVSASVLGYAVAVQDNTVVAGAPNVNGAAYVFVRSGTGRAAADPTETTSVLAATYLKREVAARFRARRDGPRWR